MKMKGKRYYEEVMNEILEYVKTYPGCSIGEIAEEIGHGWVTVKRYLQILKKLEKVEMIKGKRNRWIQKL